MSAISDVAAGAGIAGGGHSGQGQTEDAREMARLLLETTVTECLWRRRYLREGLVWLQTRARSGSSAPDQ
jgi:hypothetical protein